MNTQLHLKYAQTCNLINSIEAKQETSGIPGMWSWCLDRAKWDIKRIITWYCLGQSITFIQHKLAQCPGGKFENTPYDKGIKKYL